jgi:lipid-binding SYLF domain-containing protein
MKTSIRALTIAAALAASITTATIAQADPAPVKYDETVALFRHAGKSAAFFHHSYAYAVFPNIGEGAFVVGGAGGKGGVFVGGKQTGVATIAKVSVGFQAGGKDFSEIIFFKDKRALDEFESGNFEFGADASVIAITAAADAGAGTTGAQAGASGGEKDAKTEGHYYKGMVVFTIAKGGLMYQAAVAGQKFSYKPLSEG